jgi:uncharacterized protein
MKKIHLDKQNLKILLEILTKYKENIDILYFFGSRVRGDNDLRSDIDLAIKTQNNDFLEQLREDLSNSNISVFVDVLDMDEIADNFVKEIKKNGIIYTI